MKIKYTLCIPPPDGEQQSCLPPPRHREEGGGIFDFIYDYITITYSKKPNILQGNPVVKFIYMTFMNYLFTYSFSWVACVILLAPPVK